MQFRILSIFFAQLLFLFSGFLLLFTLFGFFIYPNEGDYIYFFYTFIITSSTSTILYFVSPKRNISTFTFTFRESFAIAGLSWVILAFFGCLPFYLSNTIPSFIDSYFEMISGLTTTGASILHDPSKLGHLSLLWRSFSHWIGGMGIIILSLAIFPGSKVPSSHLFRTETTGISSNESTTTMTDIAKKLYLIYIFLSILLFILLTAFQMPIFEALCHTFGTLGTGGFSPLQKSIGEYAYIGNSNAFSYEIIITIFMFLAGINFSIYLNIFVKKKYAFWQNIELRYYCVFILLAIIIITVDLYLNNSYDSLAITLRHTTFTSISIITTTGYSTENFDVWPTLSKSIIFLLMFSGGMGSSTAGGIKVIRVVYMFKTFVQTNINAIHPQRIHLIKLAPEFFTKPVYDGISIFIILFISILGLSFLLLATVGLTIETTLSIAISALSNIGPGFGSVSPVENYALLPGYAKLLLSFIMLLGRFELIPILALFNYRLWKK